MTGEFHVDVKIELHIPYVEGARLTARDVRVASSDTTKSSVEAYDKFFKTLKPSQEGCLSLPDFTANVRRAMRVVVRYQDEWGSWHELDAEDFEAVVVQHEIDHIDGVLFLDPPTTALAFVHCFSGP